MDILTLGEKIKAKRKMMNLTLKELAGNRITPGQISLVESGKSKPSIDLLEYLASRLNTNVDYFLESEETQVTRICGFYIDVAEAAISDGNIVRANESIDRGMYYAQKYNLVHMSGKFKLAQAKLKLKSCEYERAQQYALQANAILVNSGVIKDTVQSFIIIGIATFKMDYVSTALDYFFQADSIMNENNYMDEFIRAKIYYYISLCYLGLENNSEAMRYAKMSRDRLDILSDRKKYAQTMMVLSIAYGQENKLDDAMKYADQANRLFSEIDKCGEVADIETSLGVMFSNTENMEESFEHFKRAISLRKQINDNNAADSMMKMCANYISINLLDEAQALLDEADKYIGDKQERLKIEYYKYRYKIYVKRGMSERAEDILLEATRYIERIDYRDNKELLADFYIEIGQFYISIKEKSLALNFISKGIDIHKNILKDKKNNIA